MMDILSRRTNKYPKEKKAIKGNRHRNTSSGALPINNIDEEETVTLERRFRKKGKSHQG